MFLVQTDSLTTPKTNKYNEKMWKPESYLIMEFIALLSLKAKQTGKKDLFLQILQILSLHVLVAWKSSLYFLPGNMLALNSPVDNDSFVCSV